MEPMNANKLLSDFDHPAVRGKADELTGGKSTVIERVESIFHFIRDEIQFGFPPRWDAVKASETLEYQMGYCSTKATLFLALCKAAEIPARLHTGLIRLEILWGVLPPFAFSFLPDVGSHTWIEVEMAGVWQPVDSYINDLAFYQRALLCLQENGRTTGFSISHAKGASSPALNFGEEGFVHMGAVVGNHGTWDDFSAYMASDYYIGMSKIELMVYPLMRWIGNRNVKRIRG